MVSHRQRAALLKPTSDEWTTRGPRRHPRSACFFSRKAAVGAGSFTRSRALSNTPSSDSAGSGSLVPRFDVIGLGSLNVDFIAPTEAMSAAGRSELLQRFERGAETETDDHEEFLATLTVAQRESRTDLV